MKQVEIAKLLLRNWPGKTDKSPVRMRSREIDEWMNLSPTNTVYHKVLREGFQLKHLTITWMNLVCGDVLAVAHYWWGI